VDTASRSVREVFDDPLWQGKYGSVEDDCIRNYAENVVLLTGHGVYGAMMACGISPHPQEKLPDAAFECRARLPEGEVCFLKRTAPREPGSRMGRTPSASTDGRAS
jgi:hypothetical protein